MITSKITSKGQTTVPRAVRAALKLAEGDEVAYEISGNKVIVSKASGLLGLDPFALFSEWDSEADRKGYDKL